MTTGVQTFQRELRHALQSLWKRRWLAVAVAWLVAVLAAPAVMLAPNRFEAAAQIYVDTQTVLKPLMQGLAYTPDIDQQVRMLARTLISRPNIEKLVGRTDVGLGPGATASERERMVGQLMERIKIVPAGTSNLYAITYRDKDARVAQRTVEATLDLFVNAGTLSTKRDSEEASQFIDEQIKVYEAKLVEAEGRLKDFKVRNFGSSGVSSQDFFARMSLLSEEVSKLRLDLAAAEQSREAFRRELAVENPQLPTDGAAAAPPVALSEVDARLEAQKKLLDELLRRFTDEHPDVVSTRRVIAQLEGQRRVEAEARAASAAAGKPKVNAATSPVYQKIRIALAEAEAQVASLRSQLVYKESRLDQIRAAAGKVPQIEADLAQLNRDYDIINKNYQALVSRRESASLGIKLDESSRLADFRVIEPPRVLPTPVFPGRIHLAAFAVLAALAAGLAAPLLLDLVLPTYRTTAALEKATGRKVLGSLSMTFTPDHRRQMRTQALGVALACGALLLVQGGWILWIAGRLPT
jgi:polysaccharide chain length determinant protein (PEP-CTERM system associated)